MKKILITAVLTVSLLGTAMVSIASNGCSISGGGAYGPNYAECQAQGGANLFGTWYKSTSSPISLHWELYAESGDQATATAFWTDDTNTPVFYPRYNMSYGVLETYDDYVGSWQGDVTLMIESSGSATVTEISAIWW